MAQEMPPKFFSPAQTQNQNDLSNASEQTQLPFPTEVIELIFQHLSVFQLKQVRRTCRLWKTIVDGSVILLRKFCLNLPKGVILDQACEPACLLSVPHVFVSNARIISLEPWWPVLGENLGKLRIFNSKFSLPMLAGVLRRTPNLKELDLFYNQYPTNVDVSQFANFQLDRIQQLRLHDHQDKLIQLLRRICPRPRNLECNADDMEQQIIEYLQTAQESLERVKISATDPILTTMSSLPRLRLKIVILSCILTTSEKMLQFAKAQPTIEILSLEGAEFNNAIMCEIGRNLPNLRNLHVELLSTSTSDATIWRPTFLATMPHLVYLSIDADFIENLRATFEGYQNPNLEEITLCGLNFEASEALGRYLRHSPHLQKLALQNTTILAESDLFANLPLSKLHTLTLINVLCCDEDECLVEKFENLRVLELNEIDMSEDLASAIIQLSPNLESVRICKLPLNDRLVLELCQSLKRLKTLSLRRCHGITDASVEHIITHCHALEQLDVSTSSNLSKEATNRLKQTGRFQLKQIFNFAELFIW
ncbi:uncharacterized protein LOC120422715 [Culex pipiens pallens]|uniref:uncharacterized protein LOC120422715 n=1 Tax=Culex pipiens pallens TaxID=42434 RepID=UPI001952ECFB|nr:uncharacterized protein LOC120422715 [Culex pipiens pallens]